MIASDLKNKKIYFFRLSKISIELIKYFNANEINFAILFDKYFDTTLKEYCINNGLATNQQFCDIDIFDYNKADYIILTEGTFSTETQIDDKIKNLFTNIKDKIVLEAEFVSLLFPDKIIIGVIGESYKHFIDNYLHSICNNANKSMISDISEVNKNFNIEKDDILLTFLTKDKIKFLKTLLFDFLIVLELQDFIEDKTDTEEEYIIGKQDAKTKIIVNIDNGYIKELYDSNLFQQKLNFVGDLVPISINKKINNGFSFVNGTIYNYFDQENESYDLPQNEFNSGNIRSMSILSCFIVSKYIIQDAKTAIDTIKNISNIKNCLEAIYENENIRLISNLNIINKNMFLEAFKVYNSNNILICVINNKDKCNIALKEYTDCFKEVYFIDIFNMLRIEESKKIRSFKFDNFDNFMATFSKNIAENLQNSNEIINVIVSVYDIIKIQDAKKYNSYVENIKQIIIGVKNENFK